MKYLTLSGIGEPLLNPGFFSAVDMLAERGMKCGFFTNGTLLTLANCEKILQRRNITFIAITCDGATQHTFESSRLGAVFETWRERVSDFTTAARRLRPDLPLSVFTLVQKENAGELEAIDRLAAGLRFDHVNFLDPTSVDEAAESQAL